MWTTGTLVEEDEPPVDECTGVGNGNPARVGIDDGFTFHTAPYSCTENIRKITNLSNYDSNKAPGKFAFETHKAAVLLTYKLIPRINKLLYNYILYIRSSVLCENKLCSYSTFTILILIILRLCNINLT